MDMSTRRISNNINGGGAAAAAAATGRHGPGRPSQFSAPRELWEQHRSRIEALYWVEQRPLPQLMGIMEKEHGFCATAKMYKLRFKEWGLEKNIKSDEAKAMLTIRKRRREELNAETEFVLRGRVVTDVKLDRFQKRLKIDVEALAADAKWDIQNMGLEYRTPKTVSTDDDDDDEGEPIDSSFQDDAFDRTGSSTPRQNNNITPAPASSDPADEAETPPASTPERIPSTLALSQKRLEIINSLFKQVKAISIDRTCHDILIPAMATGDDELIRVLIRDDDDEEDEEEEQEEETTDSPSGNLIKRHLLHLAVVHGRSSLINLILEKGADINTSPPGTSPVLHQAVLHHRTTKIVDILLEANATIDATDKAGRTALGLAVSLGKSRLVKHLARSGADVDYSLHPSLPPLYEAMLTTKNMEIFQLLKSYGALTCTTDSCRLERVINEEWIPFSYTLLAHSAHGICKFNMLHKACELGKVEDVSSLLSDLSFLTPSQSRKILSLALANKYLDLAKLLVSRDVGNLNESIYDGKSALELSVDIGDPDLVSLAMAKTKPSLYPIALLMAVHLQNFPVAKLLLDAGTSQTDTLLQYPLTVAAQKGDNNLVSLLLRHGADPNHQNQYGLRPLELAVDWGRDTTAEILIQAGAVPSANLLSNAIRNRLSRLARHILTHCSADPNQICPDTGLSPLQEESSKRDPNYELVNLLLRFGADMYQTSPWQATAPSPLLKAIRERNTLLVKCLLDNHKCNRLRCRRELPVVLREADPLLLSDVQDSISGHDSRLWRPGEQNQLEEMDMDIDAHNHHHHLNAHMDLDAAAAAAAAAHGHAGIDDDMAAAVVSGHAETQGLHDHRHAHSLDQSTAGYGHYDPGPQQQQHHHHMAVAAAAAAAAAGVGQHSSPQQHTSQPPPPPGTTPHHHGSTGSVYGFDQTGAHHQTQDVPTPVIDFRTMTTIYPYWNPILLGVIPPHNEH